MVKNRREIQIAGDIKQKINELVDNEKNWTIN